ncbi:TetR family transcriptional regulator [Oleiphilus messinensis]|uniref:TetR family transcriptional regulator n=1 Tax=Oleiphilus messinensis TaxID=141451 RepID=A0A1Y0IFK0_9GAMM|nr:TetR/AcrR family transcriptional regulator [Oleiphilus messinensis]ARU59297.1 TetR family transcriptional regulator [Oleiphilus messinensis]
MSKKAETQARIVEAAGRGIRMNGYGGIGIDGIAKGAGVTSGALYGHFKSKSAVFDAVIQTGMDALIEGIQAWQQQEGEQWLKPFLDWYLSEEQINNLCDGCALPGLAVDISRGTPEQKQFFAERFQRVIELVESGLSKRSDSSPRMRAQTILTLLTGTVSVARAIDDSNEAQSVIRATKITLDSLT